MLRLPPDDHLFAGPRLPGETVAGGDGSARNGRAPSEPTNGKANDAPVAIADQQALGEIRVQGAHLLQQVGRSLAVGADGGQPEAPAADWARVETDPKNGRREQRIALPDSSVLSSWVSAASGFLEAAGLRAR